MPLQKTCLHYKKDFYPDHWSPAASSDVLQVWLWTYRTHVSTRTLRTRKALLTGLPFLSWVSWMPCEDRWIHMMIIYK